MESVNKLYKLLAPKYGHFFLKRRHYFQREPPTFYRVWDFLPSLEEGYVNGLLMSFFLVLGLCLSLDLVLSEANILKILTIPRALTRQDHQEPSVSLTEQIINAISRKF